MKQSRCSEAASTIATAIHALNVLRTLNVSQIARLSASRFVDA